MQLVDEQVQQDRGGRRVLQGADHDDHDDGVYTTGQYTRENKQKIALLHENWF